MRIGDLAARTGLTTKTIRFYENSGLLHPPPRTRGGYRDYPEQAATRLAFIRDAQHAGLTLADRAAHIDPAACGADDICTILTPERPRVTRAG
ncbi:MerR family transcriptional regulator [Streptomyces sp. ISL-43]|uniref:MerR family transcriptional regulator n=1 Tax=Streptomyces sp. ISL-43 TaxID=2819183 RepID=UPI001BE767CE|nr:MerR family transcriptional regulator [Streptomyces sp. ISL-43]MBT2452295.1 MerR family transcriptional regulator [Streptomyces sp. ISL-43]